MTEQTTVDPKQMLRNLYAAYVGKEASPEMTGTQIREALRGTAAYKEHFARIKDEGATLDEMLVQQIPSQDLPAWLINGDYVNEFKGKKKGHGAMFRLPNGKPRFVEYGGPMPNAPPILSEFVFPGVTIIRSIAEGTEDYDFKGAKPVARKHGHAPPPSDLTKALAKCWNYVPKLGVVKGESYDHEFVIATITDSSDDIRFYPPGDFSDKPSLKYLALDAVGNVIEVEADVEQTARQIGISTESPPQVWKTRLRGRPIAASGRLSVFMRRGDSFFGADGSLAAAAANQGARMVDGKEGRRALSLKDLYNKETNAQPAIQIGEKWVYRLESRPGTDGKTYWDAYVRLDGETDSQGRPKPPTLDCVVKTSKAGKSYNDGAFVTYIGTEEGRRKASDEAKQLLLVD